MKNPDKPHFPNGKFYSLSPSNKITKTIVPPGIVPFQAQVAGHIYEPGTKTIGILQDRKDDTTIYKSFGKPACGLRETKFYMSLVEDDCQLKKRQYNNPDSDIDSEKHEILSELKSFIPKFFGHVKFNFNGSEVSWFLCLCDFITKQFH